MSQLQLRNIDQILKTEKEAAVLTSGTSMQPLFRQHKDIVIIERLNRPLKKYDVPAYRVSFDKRFVLHRIVKIKNDGSFVIRGDNRYSNEYNVKTEDIVGVLKAFYRDGKYCDCTKSFKYKTYCRYIVWSYPWRKLWKLKVRPFLSKIKHLIIK